MRGKIRSSIFTIWVKTLANLILHQWLETAEVKQIFTFHFITLKQTVQLSNQKPPFPCNQTTVLAIDAQSNSQRIPSKLNRTLWFPPVSSVSLSLKFSYG